MPPSSASLMPTSVGLMYSFGTLPPVTSFSNTNPLPAGSGFVFENDVTGGRVPKEYINPTEVGIKEALEGGILAGYPMSDIKVTLYDGSYHDVDSSEMAFKIAGSMAIKEAARRAKPILLEPIMTVEVVVPEDYMGDV